VCASGGTTKTQRRKPTSDSSTDAAPTVVAARSTGSSRRPRAAGSSSRGTPSSAYVQAVANHVQISAVPPESAAASTTAAGSRRMSGQSKVDDSAVPAAAKASGTPEAALALLDIGGTEAASIRRIAAAVGVAPNAVYTYFPDKSAVVAVLVERLLGEVDHSVLTDERRPWRDRIETLALDLRSRLLAHPGAVPLLLSGPMDGLHALTLGERLLDALAGGGLDPAAAARGSYAIITYVLGAIALEAADVPQPGPLAPEQERIAGRRTAFAEAFPAPRQPPTSWPPTSAPSSTCGACAACSRVSPPPT
jgi:TetR/AcrR family tetracycline transcriptional repressor